MAHRCVVAAEEALLDPRPEGEGDDEDLVGLLHVLEGGDQQLAAAQLLLALGPLVLSEPV